MFTRTEKKNLVFVKKNIYREKKFYKKKLLLFVKKKNVQKKG